MSSSKFASSRGRGKTPAICRKVQRPKPATIPDSDHPIIHPKPLYATIEFRSIAPAHPWRYAHRQALNYAGGIVWFTSKSLHPDFKLSILLFYDYAIPHYQITTTINHQNHGNHVATIGPTLYEAGPAFHLPRFHLDVSPYPHYQCNMTLSL